MKHVKCKSGATGWQCRLRESYATRAEFISYSETFGLAARLGFATPAAAWRADPVVQGSVNPSDFRKVRA